MLGVALAAGAVWFAAFTLCTLSGWGGPEWDLPADGGPEGRMDEIRTNQEEMKTKEIVHEDGGWAPLSGARPGWTVRIRLNGERECELPNLYRLPKEGEALMMWDEGEGKWVESRLRLDTKKDTFMHV